MHPFGDRFHKPSSPFSPLILPAGIFALLQPGLLCRLPALENIEHLPTRPLGAFPALFDAQSAAVIASLFHPETADQTHSKPAVHRSLFRSSEEAGMTTFRLDPAPRFHRRSSLTWPATF